MFDLRRRRLRQPGAPGGGLPGDGGPGCPPEKYIAHGPHAPHGVHRLICDGGGTGGVGGTVATGNATQGADCDHSPFVLGTSNLPGGTSGNATTVIDIFSLQNAQGQVAAWVYETYNGNFFVQGNANLPSVLAAFTALLGPTNDFTSAFLNAIDNPEQVSQQQLDGIEGADADGGFHPHDCFKSPLQVG